MTMTDGLVLLAVPRGAVPVLLLQLARRTMRLAVRAVQVVVLPVLLSVVRWRVHVQRAAKRKE